MPNADASGASFTPGIILTASQLHALSSMSGRIDALISFEKFWMCRQATTTAAN